MAQVEREVVESQTQGDGVRSQKTVVNQTSHTDAGLKIEELVYFITSLVELFLVIRVVLTLLGANRENAFANFVYTTSYPIVAPFFGLFSHTFAYGVARLEVETLVAMAVVAIIGWGIASIVAIIRR